MEGKTAEAIPSFQEALRQNPDHFIAMVNLGNAYRQLPQWPEARDTLTRALSRKPEDPDANYALGMVFAQTDDTEKAFDYLQRALNVRPTYAEALNNLGILYLRTHRRDQAVASFENCIRLTPEFDSVLLESCTGLRFGGQSIQVSGRPPGFVKASSRPYPGPNGSRSVAEALKPAKAVGSSTESPPAVSSPIK